MQHSVKQLVSQVMKNACPDGVLNEPIALCCKERGVIIHPSAKERGRWQATYFSDASLFEVDSQHITLEEAVETVIRQGYTEDGHEMLQDCMAKKMSIH